jgi:hypothetical protein
MSQGVHGGVYIGGGGRCPPALGNPRAPPLAVAGPRGNPRRRAQGPGRRPLNGLPFGGPLEV